jgi:hypothetical protein
MTPQQLIGISVRLFALWLVARSIPYFGSIPTQLAATPIAGSESASTLSYAIGAAYFVGAILLWFFPMAVAHRLLPRTQHTNHLSFQSRELARVGCGLLGLWLFATELPALTWFLFRAFLVVGPASSFGTLDGQTKLEIIVAIVELALAIILIAKADFFARMMTNETALSPAESDDL